MQWFHVYFRLTDRTNLNRKQNNDFPTCFILYSGRHHPVRRAENRNREKPGACRAVSGAHFLHERDDVDADAGRIPRHHAGGGVCGRGDGAVPVRGDDAQHRRGGNAQRLLAQRAGGRRGRRADGRGADYDFGCACHRFSRFRPDERRAGRPQQRARAGHADLHHLPAAFRAGGRAAGAGYGGRHRAGAPQNLQAEIHQSGRSG